MFIKNSKNASYKSVVVLYATFLMVCAEQKYIVKYMLTLLWKIVKFRQSSMHRIERFIFIWGLERTIFIRFKRAIN